MRESLASAAAAAGIARKLRITVSMISETAGLTTSAQMDDVSRAIDIIPLEAHSPARRICVRYLNVRSRGRGNAAGL